MITDYFCIICFFLNCILDYSSYCDQQLINEMVEDRNHFTPKMDKFLKQICPSLLLWELLLFQGIPIKSEVCIAFNF